MTMTPAQWMLEPLRKYAQFTGRATRPEYWWYTLLLIVVSIIGTILDATLNTFAVGALITFGLLIPNLAVSVRRLHDIDRTGWWIIAPLVLGIVVGFFAFAGFASISSGSGVMSAGLLVAALGLIVMVVVSLVWFCSDGTVGANRFGPDPKGR